MHGGLMLWLGVVSATTAAESASGDSFVEAALPLLGAAALTLLSTLGVQKWFMPRVERQKRREQRWEGYVAELTELLAFTLPSAGREYASAIHSVIVWKDLPEGADEARWREIQRRYDSELGVVRNQVKQHTDRAKWLLDRVAPKVTAVDGGEGGKVWMTTMRSVSIDPIVRVDPLYITALPTTAELDRARRKSSAFLEEATEALDALSDLGRPPKAASRRARRVSAARRRRSEREKAAAAKQQTPPRAPGPPSAAFRELQHTCSWCRWGAHGAGAVATSGQHNLSVE
jgi:hypothetical protein